MIQNRTKFTIKGLYLHLKDGHSFGKSCWGGSAFPVKSLARNSSEITFGGGSIGTGEWFWSQIPLSVDYPGGKGKYEGNAIAEMKLVIKAPEAHVERDKIFDLLETWTEEPIGERKGVPFIQAYGESPRGGVLCLWTSKELWIGSRHSRTLRSVAIEKVIPRGINRISYETIKKTPSFVLWFNGHRELVVPISEIRD